MTMLPPPPFFSCVSQAPVQAPSLEKTRDHPRQAAERFSVKRQWLDIQNLFLAAKPDLLL